MHGQIPSNIKEILFSKQLYGNNSAGCRIVFENKSGNNILYNVENVNIQHDRSQFNSSATFTIINVNPNDPTDLGYYTPYRNNSPLKPQNEWFKQIVPSKRIRIEMGYYDEWVSCFTGYIKSVNINTEPGYSSIEVTVVDVLGYFCMEQWVNHKLPVETDPIDKYYLEYPIPTGYDTAWVTPGGTQPVPIEDVVKDLICRASSYINVYDIIIEPTYMTWEGEFDKITFAQALETLKETSQFVLFCDGSGKIYFQPKQNRNTTRTGTRQLTGTNWCDPFNYQIVDDINNIAVTNGMGLTYTKDVDYELDTFKNAIRRKTGSSILSGQIVEITYKNCDYIFKNGINIYKANYELNHNDIYGSVYVNGDAGEHWEVITDGLLWDGSYIHIEKVKEIQNDILETEAEIVKRCQREQKDMLEEYMSLQLTTVGIPWLNIFDLFQCYIFGAVREIYIIDSYNLTYQNGECTSEITAHHYAYHALT